jgi:hypothetical protein
MPAASLQGLSGFPQLGEIAGTMVAFWQKAGPSRRKVKVGAAAGQCYVFTDMKVGQVGPLLPYVMRLRSCGIWFLGVHLCQPIFVVDGLCGFQP